MKNLDLWKRLSSIALYTGGALLIVDTFFLEDIRFLPYISALELMALALLLFSGVMILLLKYIDKKKRNE